MLDLLSHCTYSKPIHLVSFYCVILSLLQLTLDDDDDQHDTLSFFLGQLGLDHYMITTQKDEKEEYILQVPYIACN